MGDAVLLSLFGGVVYSNPIVWIDAIPLLIILVLLLCSAFMSSNEVAFFSLNPQEVQQIKEQEHPNDPRLLRLLSHSEQLLATILIGNNAVNVAITILCAWLGLLGQSGCRLHHSDGPHHFLALTLWRDHP